MSSAIFRNVVVTIIALFLSATVSAEPIRGIRGNALMKWANSYEASNQGRGTDDDLSYASTLQGFVAAVADRAAFDGKVCVRDGITYEQLVAISIKRIRAMPELWDIDGFVLVEIVLKEAFPCSKK